MKLGRTWRGAIRAFGGAFVPLMLVSVARASSPPAGTPVPVPGPVPVQPGGGNAADKNVAFVQHLFQDVLGRAADPSAITTYGSGLTRGTITRQQVAQAVLGSQENANLVVTGLYNRLLHHPPDQPTLAYYATVLQNGGTAEQVEAQILASPEYYARR
jgi:hypothetical protein